MKWTRMTGWVLSGLLAAFLVGASARAKFTEWDGKAEAFATFGYTADVMYGIGIVEVACAVLFVLPWTGFLGAILLTGYLGGATATHVRVGDPFAMPVVMGVVVWVAVGLRRPEVFTLAFGYPRRDADSTD